MTALSNEKGTKVRASCVFILIFNFFIMEVCCEIYYQIINLKRHDIKPIIS